MFVPISMGTFLCVALSPSSFLYESKNNFLVQVLSI
jgi:hypothetical protein